jgi:hypothetical protein
MGRFSFHGLREPFPKHKEIMRAVLAPGDGKVKQIDVCCGLGFGKTTLGIEIACLALNYNGDQRLLFLEPDWDRVITIFWEEWERIVPKDLYTFTGKGKGGDNKITWYNGSTMLIRPRDITGSKSRARDKFRGPEFTAVIDDETAVSFDMEQYTNINGRIRRPSEITFHLTLTTPQIGAYSRLIKMEGHRLFKGRTRDNIFLPDGYEARLRASMSSQQARRELDAEMIALEGGIWPDADIHTAWPHGNRHDHFRRFNPDEPWWIFCDWGSSFGSYVVVQKTTDRGRFKSGDRSVWVAVADLCPLNDASAEKAFIRLRDEFGIPAGIVGGSDVNTKTSGDGKTIAFFANQVWSGVNIHPCSENKADRLIQYNRLSYLICSSLGERRFCVAKNFVSLDNDSKRGVREMLEEDAWPNVNDRNPTDFLPKGRDNVVQHVRDALLLGAVKIMSPPSWRHYPDPTG